MFCNNVSSEISEYIPTNKSNLRRFEAIVDRVPEDADRILDVGSARHSAEQRAGGNLHAFLASRLEAHVLGIDLLTEEVERMRREGFNVAVADAESFTFEEPFDAIVAGELIEHLPNPGRFIENAVDHLRAEGKLILTTPNPDGFVFFRKALLNQANNPTHICWIDNSNLLTLCEHVRSARLGSVDFLPPDGGVSSVLLHLGRRRSASPTYVATIERAEGSSSDG